MEPTADIATPNTSTKDEEAKGPVPLVQGSHEDSVESIALLDNAISGDRNILLTSDFVALLETIISNDDLLTVRKAASALRLICTDHPQSSDELLVRLVPLLLLTLQYPVPAVALDSVWALVSLSSTHIHLVTEEFLPLIIHLLAAADTQFLLPSLRFIANVSENTDAAQRLVVEAGCLPILCNNLAVTTSTQEEQKEIYRVVANLCNSGRYIPAVIQSEIVPHLISAIGSRSNKNDEQATRQALVGCAYIAFNQLDDQIDYLVENGLLEALCVAMSLCENADVLRIALDCASSVLENGADREEEENEFAQRISSHHLGELAIAALIDHDSPQVRTHAQKIFEEYFECQ